MRKKRGNKLRFWVAAHHGRTRRSPELRPQPLVLGTLRGFQGIRDPLAESRPKVDLLAKPVLKGELNVAHSVSGALGRTGLVSKHVLDPLELLFRCREPDPTKTSLVVVRDMSKAIHEMMVELVSELLRRKLTLYERAKRLEKLGLLFERVELTGGESGGGQDLLTLRIRKLGVQSIYKMIQ